MVVGLSGIQVGSCVVVGFPLDPGWILCGGWLTLDPGWILGVESLGHV